MMCEDLSSSCEKSSDEYIIRIPNLQDHLHLLIAIVIRVILSVVIGSNKAQR